MIVVSTATTTDIDIRHCLNMHWLKEGSYLRLQYIISYLAELLQQSCLQLGQGDHGIWQK